MKTVIAHLNAVVEDRMPTALTPGPCRLALQAIETQQLAVNALRLILGQRVNMKPGGPATVTEALDHGQRLIDTLDKEIAHIEKTEVSGKALPPVAPAKPLNDEDISDLA